MPTGGSKTALSLAAFYADCRHDVLKVTPRITLTYDLLLQGDPGPPAGDGGTAAELTDLLREHFSTPVPRCYGGPVAGRPNRLVYLLDHEYTPRGLNWRRLKGADASRVALLRAAADTAGCEAVLALADVKTTHSAFPLDDYDEDDDECSGRLRLPAAVGMRDCYRASQDGHGRRAADAAQQGSRGRGPGDVGAVRRLPGHLPAHRGRRGRCGHPEERISFPEALAAAASTVTAFPLDRLELALATLLLKILMSAFLVRDRRGRASPRKSKKASDFAARKPGEPSVTNVARRIEFHQLFPWQVT